MEKKLNFLEQRILKDGIVKEGNVLRVDSFLNHQLDVELLEEIGKEFYKRFKSEKITKVLTVEASGIAIACFVAQKFKVPVVFAKKSKSINLSDDVYSAEVESFTHKTKNTVVVTRKYISKNDRVLVIDDFLANGAALQGLISILNQAGATVAGIGIAIEKGFQPGGQFIRNLGYHLESLAIVESMEVEPKKINFRK
ncbi:xanthine phosphoribosyltransferase [Treponema sp.]|uniref:xanthine phosphoribosyltransferase n=1 Tax=Treponema sp. TaxID=166 RepID=UPI00298E3D6A|nr:xanthine phosphoribosyltransferase [Treponema sp.]MCI7397853.1 xanthine phosphoribosyltransferase [Spirochaetia bacterium]